MRIDGKVTHLQGVAGGLDLTTAACARTLGLDATFHAREASGVVNIAPQHHLAAVPLVCGVGLNAGALRHQDLCGLADVAAALPVAAHQHRAAALRAVGVNAACAGQFDLIGHEHHLAAFFGQASGAQLSTVLDDRTLQAGQRMGREDDLPAFGEHGALVVDQRSNGLRRSGQASQAGASVVEAERNGFARGQSHGAGPGNHYALVAHFGGKQGDVAAKRGFELALVDHTAGAALAIEGGFAGHELVSMCFAGGSHQAAHVHTGGGRKIHAARVAQNNLAVRTDLTIDLAGVVTLHLVEHHGTGVRLVEMHLGLAANIKAGPVDHCAGTGLVNRHLCCGRVAGDACTATADHAALRQLLSRRRSLLGMGQAGYASQQHAGHGGGHGASGDLSQALSNTDTSAFACAASRLGYGLQLQGMAILFKAVNMVHVDKPSVRLQKRTVADSHMRLMTRVWSLSRPLASELGCCPRRRLQVALKSKPGAVCQIRLRP